MTPDGRFVVFVSSANSLVPGGGNSQPEVFVRDRREGKTEMVSVAVGGEAGNSGSGWMPAISADGRFVAFSSSASNLVENDTNDASDVFVRDREKGTTERVSLSSEGKEGDGNCGFPRISADGMLVAFISEATNLVEGDTNGKQDVFIRDRTKGKTYRVSMGPEGKEGNGDSGFCAMSACGRWVAFHSAASNLVAGDENGKLDVFLLDRETGAISAISVTASGKTGDGDSVGPAAAGDGKTIAFLSFAGDLVKGDNNGQPDVFAWGTR
jgi:Tol biopolymer transport system component